MRLSMLIVLCAGGIAAVAMLGTSKTEQDRTPTPQATHLIRTLTSASCPTDGCPTRCAEDETLMSALCVRASTARLADTLRVDNGVLTAGCGANADSVILYCARK